MRSNRTVTEKPVTIQRRYWHRVRDYLREMYPIPPRAAYAIVLSAGVGSMLETVTLNGVGLSLRGLWLGAFTVFSFALVLRLMDELKDTELDRALFSHRPLPSGRISEKDIVGLLTATVLLYLAVHVVAGTLLPGPIVLLGYGFLMFRYFFLSKRWHGMLLVNLATHNPVTAILLVALVELFTEGGTSAGQPTSGEIAQIIAYFWPPVLGWELARKIRYPREETAYVTYSRLLGPGWALGAAGGVQAVGLLVGMAIAWRHGMSLVFPAILILAALLLARSYVRFGRGLLASGVELKVAAEQYAGLVMAAPTVEHLWKGVIDHVA